MATTTSMGFLIQYHEWKDSVKSMLMEKFGRLFPLYTQCDEKYKRFSDSVMIIDSDMSYKKNIGTHSVVLKFGINPESWKYIIGVSVEHNESGEKKSISSVFNECYAWSEQNSLFRSLEEGSYSQCCGTNRWETDEVYAYVYHKNGYAEGEEGELSFKSEEEIEAQFSAIRDFVTRIEEAFANPM